MFRTLQCSTCGEDYEAKRSDSRFCPPCRKLEHSKHMQEYEKRSGSLCLDCGIRVARRSDKCKQCEDASRKSDIPYKVRRSVVQTRYYDSHKDDILSKHKTRYYTDIDVQRERHRLWRYNRYGKTYDELMEMLVAQESKCLICGVEMPPGKDGLNIDHDHASGRVRGFLCRRCNLTLGYMQDNPTLLRAAADYIEYHKAKDTHTHQIVN